MNKGGSFPTSMSEERLIATFWRALQVRFCTQNLIQNPEIWYNSLTVNRHYNVHLEKQENQEFALAFEKDQKEGLDPIMRKKSFFVALRKKEQRKHPAPWVLPKLPTVTEAGMNLLNFAIIPIPRIESPPQRRGEHEQENGNLLISREEGKLNNYDYALWPLV